MKMTGPLAAALLALAACSPPADQPAHSLPALNALPAVTVAGVSSGAYMAGQYHVAYADDVTGAGLVAGGPWGCAGGSMQQALGACMTGAGLDVAALAERASQLESDGDISSLDELAGDRVFVFRGTRDAVVATGVADAAAEWYRLAAPRAALREVRDVEAVHGLPSLSGAAACDEFVAPFINACDYDLAGDMLAHLLGDLRPPASAQAPVERFSQAPYAATGLADEGLLVVPAQCRGDVRCQVHVFFHGCSQSLEQVGTAVAEQGGLRRWAESNDLVLLFPQVASSQVAPMNPLACWDWWGYSGDDYLSRDGSQLAAVHAMVSRLQAAP